MYFETRVTTNPSRVVVGPHVTRPSSPSTCTSCRRASDVRTIAEKRPEQAAAHEAESESWTVAAPAEPATATMTARTKARLERTRCWIGVKAGRKFAESGGRCRNADAIVMAKSLVGALVSRHAVTAALASKSVNRFFVTVHPFLRFENRTREKSTLTPD